MSLPHMDAPSYTVTLITGDRVRLTEVASGHYAVSAISGTGPSTHIDFEVQGNAHNLTSLLATPDDAASLIENDQVNSGLFDLQWLLRHHDTGLAAQIPVTVQYAAPGSNAALRADAANLPGATVTTTLPSRGRVSLTVNAGNAASFWSALTVRSAKGTPPAALTGGVTRVWLTGHRVFTSPGAHPRDTLAEDTQPLYTVTETITRTNGPIDRRCGRTVLVSKLCFIIPSPSLLGVAGAGQGQSYRATGGQTCLSQSSATPYPVCTAWQLTYNVPPGVYYAHANAEFLTTDDPDGTLEPADVTLDIPQLTVAANTAISLDADDAVPVTVHAPQPATHYGPDEVETIRHLPDGTYSGSIFEDTNSQGTGNWWAVPTPAGDQATIGSYHFSPALSLGAPEITAAVTTPRRLALHPLYPCDSATLPSPLCNVARFSGRQSLQLVNAGFGTTGDFSTIDARGKLALITENYTCVGFTFCSEPGSVLWQQIENAQQAGAAGVLVDPGVDKQGYPVRLPISVDMAGDTNPLADVPFAEIDNTEGSALLGLLANGPVTVTVGDSGVTPYTYQLRFDQEGRIPASLDYTLTPGQLSEVDSFYNAASPSAHGVQIWADSYRPGEGAGVGTALDFPDPRSIRDFYGPLSPSMVWHLQAGTFGTAGYLQVLETVFARPSVATVAWNEPLDTPGASAPDNERDVYMAQQDDAFSSYCAGCRQDNTFWPVFQEVNGSNPDMVGGAEGFAPGTIHLYDQTDQEITATPDPSSGAATYQLPAQQSRYKLVVPSNNTTTTWNFTSAEPASDQTPPGTLCAGAQLRESTAPCEADPLVFLRYNAGLSLTNTLTPGTHQLHVTGYHQDLNAPPVTSLKMWTSTDGGTTWQAAKVTGGSGGAFTATYTIPANAKEVSIKAQASDAAGNDITQEIDNAYPVTTVAAAGTHR